MNGRNVGLAGCVIAQVRSSDMNPPVLQEIECLRAVATDQRDVYAGRACMRSQNRHSRITACDQQSGG